ncbi:MAG: sigma-70 family RNA polymerase sigma factor [Rhodoplanes sp.]|uniref:RNA polymerase sigma factor n=1 Tax=Rhodoplanes sp. TaxID=1968906 RepID=UPI0017B22685|nr:sigma-70 family RNA polymerase sigma factor [Rhodoplanes sp.]NVO13519.1 sigma-70 family RNA polymerase sigma factor [Rhodoplanes sp.]
MLGYDELRARLARRFGSTDLAGDALHETWLRIDGAAPAKGLRSPKHYLLRMAYNAALKRLNAESGLVTLSDAKAAIGLIDDAPDPERAVIARLELETLAQALRELTPRRRTILIASRLDGTPLWRIAEQLAISQRLVEIELRHALAHCALRLDRKVIRRFGPKSSKGSSGGEDLDRWQRDEP